MRSTTARPSCGGSMPLLHAQRRPGGRRRQRATAASGAPTCTACSTPTRSAAGSSTACACAAGLAPIGRVVAPYDIEPALDRLADVVRRSLDMEQFIASWGCDESWNIKSWRPWRWTWCWATHVGCRTRCAASDGWPHGSKRSPIAIGGERLPSRPACLWR